MARRRNNKAAKRRAQQAAAKRRAAQQAAKRAAQQAAKRAQQQAAKRAAQKAAAKAKAKAAQAKKLKVQVKKAAKDGNITRKEVNAIQKKTGLKPKQIKPAVRSYAKSSRQKGKDFKVGSRAVKALGINNRKAFTSTKGTKNKDKDVFGKDPYKGLKSTKDQYVTLPNGKKKLTRDDIKDNNPGLMDEVLDANRDKDGVADEYQDLNDLDLFDPGLDDLPEAEYDKKSAFDQEILEETWEAAEDKLKDNLKEWRQSDIDSLRIDKKDALAYRGEAFNKSLAGRYQKKDAKGKAEMLSNLRKPIHDQVLRNVNGKDPFNTFAIKNGKITTELPKKRSTGVDHSDAYQIAKQLGVPSGKSSGDTLKRLESMSKGPSVDYNKRGKDILGVKLPSSDDIRDGMPEPIELPATRTTQHRLKNPMKVPANSKFASYDLKRRRASRQAATPTQQSK